MLQLSPATPYGARTTTSPCAVQHPIGTTQEKKDIFEIWRAHKPPYTATVSPRYPLDLLALRSGLYTGRGRLAVESGLWPLKEAINGEVAHTYMPKPQPVENYLKLQGRFCHLFEPAVQTEAIVHIQERVNAYREQLKRLKEWSDGVKLLILWRYIRNVVDRVSTII
jgi:pyruvate ferredoxin oxidoreductase beta subunit